MRNSIFQEIILSLVLLVLLVFFANPFQFFMSTPVLMMLSGVLIALFAVFAGFVWRERAHDEREGMHRMLAGRLGFLAGAIVLVIGVVVQTFQHKLDMWLVSALVVMLLGKIVTLAIARTRS